MTLCDLAISMKPQLTSLMKQYVPNKEAREDLWGDVVLKCLLNESKVNPDSAKTWLYSTCRNAAIDHTRRSSTRTNVHCDDLHDCALTDPWPSVDERVLVLDVLGGLPETYVAALGSVAVGKTTKESASEAGMSVPAMKSRISRARAAIKLKRANA